MGGELISSTRREVAHYKLASTMPKHLHQIKKRSPLSAYLIGRLSIQKRRSRNLKNRSNSSTSA
ncbi:MAG: hypothetical protein V7K40_05620 [Nostoc sp.]